MVGEHVVIAYYQDGLQIFDVSNPLNVTRSGYYDTSPSNCPTCPNPNYSGCWGAYVDLPSGIILASDMQNGLFILDAGAALGISKTTLETDAFSVYPNPVKDQLNVKIKAGGGSALQVTICDLNGKSILTEQEFSTLNTGQYSISTSALSSGLYLLKVSQVDKIYYSKFSKL